MDRTASSSAEEANWKEAVESSDREAFRDLTEKYTKELLDAARHELLFYAEQGRIHRKDFTAEEIVGETFIYAWEQREHKPEDLRIKAWLLAAQHRLLRQLVAAEQQYRADKAISLDEPVPQPRRSEDPRSRFPTLYHPEEPIRWEDVTPDGAPTDIDVSLEDGQPAQDALAAHALLLHDEFKLEPEEVAYAMNASVRAIAEQLEHARTTAHERGMDGTRPPQNRDEPAPPPEG